MAGGLRSSVPRRVSSQIRPLYYVPKIGVNTCNIQCPLSKVTLILTSQECWRANDVSNGLGYRPTLFQGPTGALNGTEIFASLDAIPYKICFSLSGNTSSQTKSFAETGLILTVQNDQLVLYANQREQQPPHLMPNLMVNHDIFDTYQVRCK
jgi:hypothetical protein